MLSRTINAVSRISTRFVAIMQNIDDMMQRINEEYDPMARNQLEVYDQDIRK